MPGRNLEMVLLQLLEIVNSHPSFNPLKFLQTFSKEKLTSFFVFNLSAW